MDCKEANRRIVPFLKDELPPEEAEGLLRHIRECGSCREDLEIYYMVERGVEGLDGGALTAYDLKGQFEQYLRHTQAQLMGHSLLLKTRNVLRIAAACGAVFAALVKLLRWF